MAEIDRDSIDAANRIFNKFLPEEKTRAKFIEFLCDAIDYAYQLNCQNWNLNLDKKGYFIRFNVGQEYCIELNKRELLILCDRTTLKPNISRFKIPVKFLGHIGKKKVHSADIEVVPDCLSKTKYSVGCIITLDQISEYLDYFKLSNRDFIFEAAKTDLTQIMRNAHSRGAIDYFDKMHNRIVSQPIYALSNLPTFNDFINKEKYEIAKARKLSYSQRQFKLKNSVIKPTRTIVCQAVFNRNKYVIAEVLERAQGRCEKCSKSAPFLKDTDKNPYLEVHHIVPLAEGGDDTVENAIGLCPNCHRHAHHGSSTF
jgi:hypothetical protein